VRIKFCAAPCGSGKTHLTINRACELVQNHNRVLVLQPTRELIERTVKEEVPARAYPPPIRVFHGGTVGDGKVSKALADYARQPPDTPEIVLATHQVLPHIKQFANKGEWHVLIDEALQADRYQQHRVPQTHNLITDHLDVMPVNAIFGRVTVRDIVLHEIAKNADEDEILETLADTSRILANRYWESFVNLEQYQRLKRGEGKVLAFHSVLKPEILAGFASVLLAGANFEDSAIFKLWSEEGIEFEPDPEFAKGLRYSDHPNGDLVTINYQWSRKRREAPVGDDGSKIQDRMIQAAKELFPSGRFLWHANKPLIDDPFGSPAERLPNKPHGLNSFAGFDDIVFLSSLNPGTDHFRFLQSRGPSGGEVRGFTYFAEAYQAIMRTSIRTPDNNRNPKRILVPDRGLAEYLHDVFPGSRIEKLDIGLVEDVPKRRGRPRKHRSNRERLIQQRRKARERKLKVLADQLRLNSPDTVEKKDCGGDCGKEVGRFCPENGGTSRAENSIRLYTNFSTGPLTATIFSSTSSSIPLGYVSGETDAFIGFLRKCHEHRANSKNENFLFSPAIFDPGRSAGANRAKANIAYLRNIVLDFENGELRPEEFPNLFPGLRMVVTNTFSHTSDKPRFRALFPTSEIMTPEVYGLIQGCLADKLEDAGYSVDRGGKGRKGARLSNSRPSGLDWSKSLPTSLFYLPCQAQTSRDSFFQDYGGENRQPLQPSIWLQNMTFPLQSEFEVVQADVPRAGVDEVLVQRAKDIWRGSKEQPGMGDAMFFNLAMSLRRAGMDLYLIESTLRSEAEFGRTPKERLSQVPSIMSSLRRYCGLVS
jgi:hypothetical protein